MSNKNKNKNVSAVAEEVAVVAQAPAVEVIEAPVAEVQEIIAAEAVTSEAAAVEKKAKNKPNETTRTISEFADDTKGIRAGSIVSFQDSKKGDGKTVQGTVSRLFDFYDKPTRQEAKIMVTGVDGKSKTRFYRFEKDLTVVPAKVATEVAAEIEA